MVPIEALLKDTKREPNRVHFVTSAYAAAKSVEETGSVVELVKWAEAVMTTARIHATPDYRRGSRWAKFQAWLWRLHIHRPKTATVQELEDYLADLQRRRPRQ